jgi:hypothetical protein
MGSRVLEFQLKTDDGAVLLIEVDDPQQMGNRPIGRGMVEKARQSLEAALGEIMPGINALMAAIQALAVKPDEFGLELGVKFTLEAGAVIAKTAAEGNVKISLSWKRAAK